MTRPCAKNVTKHNCKYDCAFNKNVTSQKCWIFCRLPQPPVTVKPDHFIPFSIWLSPTCFEIKPPI